MRSKLDASLALPRLIIFWIQIHRGAGELS